MKRTPTKTVRPFVLFLVSAVALVVLLGSGCAVDKMAVQSVSDMLSSGDASVFTSEEDPRLVGDALPFALKLYETLLQMNPEDPSLLMTTGQAFALYSYAYVQMPADMLPNEEVERQLEELERAKKLYLRARGYLLRALDVRHPGLKDALLADSWDGDLAFTTAEDAPYLYWTAMSWFGALTTDFFDMKLLLTSNRALDLILRVLALDPDYQDGAVHELLVSYYGSVPKEMGGSEEKARKHFQRALELSGGGRVGTYVALAASVSVANQDSAEFRRLLQKALAVDVDEYPENRLMNIIMQRRAEWLLEHIEDFFLEVEPG